MTESKEYVGRPHFMAGLDGWEDIADDVLNWAVEHTKTQSAATAPAS